MIYNKEYLDSIKEHKYYRKTVDHADEMAVHTNGNLPKKLLETVRPNESPQIKEYRLQIWQPVTKSLADKAKNVMQRVFNPRFYSINPENEDFEEYLEDYPTYGTFINYIRESYTEDCITDPNALAVVEPCYFDISDTEQFEPVVKVYPSEYLVDYEEGEYYVLKWKDDKITYVRIYDLDGIYQFKKKGTEWITTLEYLYGDIKFEEPPCIRLGGIIKNKYYFESFISGVLPHWNRVVNLSSDLDAGYIGHMYLEKWEFETDCDNTNCRDGYVEVEVIAGGEMMTQTCKRCNGTGKVSRSPWGVHTINRDAINPDAPLPTPPAGYIDKPVEIITKAEEKIREEEKKGFSAINLEILNQVGENQSGIAKTIDRQDLDSFLQRWANHVFTYFIPPVLDWMQIWRYSINGEPQDIEIKTPKEFSVLSYEYLTEEYKAASQAKASSRYLGYIEKEIIDAKFSNNPNIRKKEIAISDLQPLKGKTIDELMAINAMFPQRSWEIYKNLNIGEIVEKAISENTDFLELELQEQKQITDLIAQNDVENTNQFIQTDGTT